MGDIVLFIRDFGPTFGVLGALVVYTLGRWSAAIERKRNFRSFLKVEFINASYNLQNMPLKDNTKLIITKEYEQIMSFLKGLNVDTDNEFLMNTYLGYMQFKNIGPGLILNASVEMHMNSETQSWESSADLPILEEGELIFIPTDKQEAFNEIYFVDKVIIYYITQQNESLKYIFQKTKRGMNSEFEVLTDTYYVKNPVFKNYIKIHSSETKRMDWLYLKNKVKK